MNETDGGECTIDEGTKKPTFWEGRRIAFSDNYRRARLGDEDMGHFFPQKSAKPARHCHSNRTDLKRQVYLMTERREAGPSVPGITNAYRLRYLQPHNVEFTTNIAMGLFSNPSMA